MGDIFTARFAVWNFDKIVFPLLEVPKASMDEKVNTFFKKWEKFFLFRPTYP